MSNRIIKFRGFFEGKMYYPDSSEAYSNAVFHCFSKVADKPKSRAMCAIMQFTGLHDKNGTEVYEGDVVRVNTVVEVGGGWDEPSEEVKQELYCKVVFNEAIAAFDLVTIQRDVLLQSWGFYGDNSDSIEIIGDIYSNPELINALNLSDNG